MKVFYCNGKKGICRKPLDGEGHINCEPCKDFSSCGGEWIEEMTRADQIRAMTDEQLAQLLAHETFRIAEPYFQYCGLGITEEVIYCERLKWLQQPAEGVAADGK